MRVIDFHTHAFPDALAERAMPVLEEEGNVKAALDGKVSSLLASMDRAGIETAVLASIATKPNQFERILTWSESVASERLIPFPSVHPADPDAAAQVRRIAAEGYKGIKLHPYYQDFDLDEERVFPLYGALEEAGLLVLCHTGFDMAFSRIRKADPARILTVVERFPGLRFIASHLGAWEDWEEVEKRFLGKPIYTDISYSVQFMPPERAKALILAHPREYVLFGSDSPWTGQDEVLNYVLSLGLGADWERSILFENASRLLGLA
ncbi:MAG: amidohydrolase family protein [Candidatus Hydrogenedentes bacterium]|nr:amidohydrolase family protein [Candidatus Hydrogenedentota bacterium]